MGNNKQVLAAWGSPGSGKTLTSIKLAREIAQKKKNVIVLLADIVCPAISTILPNYRMGDKSLGNLLSRPEISQDDVLAKCVSINKNPCISLLGYKNGDNAYSYPKYTMDRVVDLLVLLRHIADYVIVDCSSIITADVVSATALETADVVLRLGSCDIKSISYFSSHLPLLESKKFNASKHVKVLSDMKQYQISSEYSNFFGGVSHVLPYSEDLAEQYYSAKLFEGLSGEKARKYQTVISGITKEVFGI